MQFNQRSPFAMYPTLIVLQSPTGFSYCGPVAIVLQ